jgi:hypothetical protein
MARSLASLDVPPRRFGTGGTEELDEHFAHGVGLFDPWRMPYEFGTHECPITAHRSNP